MTVFQGTCQSFLISTFCTNFVFALFGITVDCIVHIFGYPDPRLSGLFRVVPMSPDNRGSTVIDMLSADQNAFF